MNDYVLNDYKWKNKKSGNTFRVYIVQPNSIGTNTENTNLFFETLNFLNNGNKVHIIDNDIKKYELIHPPPKYDLLTFPEGFLPYETLIKFLEENTIQLEEKSIHSGLRSNKDDNFLFNYNEVISLIDSLKRITLVNKKDVGKFEKWYKKYNDSNSFISLAVYLYEEKKSLRVCIHPKISRSQYEYDLQNSNHLKESNLLNIINITESLCINVQPLICSDLIKKPNDYKLPKAIDAISYKICNLIDFVSTVTCTPVQTKNSDQSQITWKSEFREIFQNSSKGNIGNYFKDSCFILTNYSKFVSSSMKTNEGGLSGLFLPNLTFEDIVNLNQNDNIQIEVFFKANKYNDDNIKNSLSQIIGESNDEGWININTIEKLSLNSNHFKNIYGALIMNSKKNNDNISMFSFKLNNLPKFFSPDNSLKLQFDFYMYEEEVWKTQN